MREITYPEVDAAAAAADETFQMDEERFRILYQRTSRPLWSYLSRVSGSPTLADDLLQESYCRFLTSVRKDMSDEHRRNYLFRIATNLMRDHWRRQKGEPVPVSEPEQFFEIPVEERTEEHVQLRRDVGRALDRLKPRERAMLWLAYVMGSSHKEIAEVMGLRTPSIRLLLFRARHKLADLLRRQGTSARDSASNARASRVVRS